MSLEQALAEHTAAIKENSSLLAKLIATYAAMNIVTSDEPAPVNKTETAKPRKQKEPVKEESDTSEEENLSPEPTEESDTTAEAEKSKPGKVYPWAAQTKSVFNDLKGAPASKENILKGIQAVFALVGKDATNALLDKFDADAVSERPGKRALAKENYVDCFGLLLRTLSGSYDPREE